MRTLFYLLPLLIFIACSSSENKNLTTQDSTAVSDSVISVPDFVEEVGQEEQVIEGDTTLEGLFSAEKNMIDKAKDSLYEVTMTNHQYEASSDARWYFDAEINAVYFSISWSMEGTEGSTELIAKDGSVICSYIEENSITEKWCQSTGGIRTAVDENSGEETKTDLDDAYGSEQSVRLRDEVATLSEFLGEAEVVEDEGDYLTLRIEKVVNYGEDFTEYAEMRIHRKVYEGLK